MFGRAERQQRSDGEEPAIKRLAAWYVSDKPLTASELRAYLAEQLPDYMLPSHFDPGAPCCQPNSSMRSAARDNSSACVTTRSLSI